MKVWIDQELCTGDGLCEEICPSIFKINDSDALAYVKLPEEDELLRDSDGNPIRRGGKDIGMVAVEAGLEEKVLEAVEECPGECIFIERD